MFNFFLNHVGPELCLQLGCDSGAMATFAANYARFFHECVTFQRSCGCFAILFPNGQNPEEYSVSVVSIGSVVFNKGFGISTTACLEIAHKRVWLQSKGFKAVFGYAF